MVIVDINKLQNL